MFIGDPLVGKRQIGIDHPPYVIAEIGVNHDGELDRALMLIESAAQAGADAVKFQYFETDRLMSSAAKLAAYQKAAGETDPIEMLRRLELSLDELEQCVKRAHELGIHAIVTVFSEELAGPASELPWDAYKSASPDLVHRPLLEAMANTGKPMIVSTGASTLDEVVRAAAWLDGIRDRLAFLQCVSCYPAPEAAFEGIGAIETAIGVPVGYSDHTESIRTGAEAVKAGACLLERHLTYDRSAAGPDHAASLEPLEMTQYIELARKAQRGVNATRPRADKHVLDCEQDVRTVSRQSIVTTRPIEPGELITRDDLTFKRPGTGLEPWQIDDVVGCTCQRVIEPDMPVRHTDLA